MIKPFDFDQIYVDYRQKIFRLCMGFLNDHAQAMDLTQEVFIKVWENLPRFRGDASISTWVYRIASNACLRHLEREKRYPKTAMPDLLDEPADNESNERIALLYRCIHALNESDRLLISMVLDDLPYPEIAEVLNINEGSLRVKIHRIKQKLSEKIQSYGSI